MRLRSTLYGMVLFAGTLPGSMPRLSAQQQQKTPPPISAQGQADALRRSTDDLYNKKLTPSETAVRAEVTLLRDSLDVVGGFAERLSRSTATNTQSVMISAARSLQPSCAAAARTITLIQPHLKAVHLTLPSNPDRSQQQLGQKVLNQYRASLVTTNELMASCVKQLGTILRSSKPDAVQLGRLATELNNGIMTYEARLRVMLNQFDIPLRPKQQN